MGDPKKLRKKYETPRHPWQADRFKTEKKLIADFGLTTKKEIWRAEATMRKYRHIARQLVGVAPEKRKAREDVLMNKLRVMGLLKEGATLDNILSLKVESLLDRRLQTLVWKRGLAATIKQSRQLITHGHISVNGRKVTAPGMIMTIDTENRIDWYGLPVKIELPKHQAGPEKPPEEPKTAEKALAEGAEGAKKG
jgi:small subunit ribosomal protein S4